MARSQTDKYFQQLVDFLVHGGDRTSPFFANACKQYGLDPAPIIKFADHVLSLKHESHPKPK